MYGLIYLYIIKTLQIMKQFNTILYNFNTRQIEFYDVLPYFRREWKDVDKNTRQELRSKLEFQKWILDKSMYMFWSRCEYECLIGPWPYREDKLIEELRKIDVHDQIKSNIDIITDILYSEFFKDL